MPSDWALRLGWEVVGGRLGRKTGYLPSEQSVCERPGWRVLSRMASPVDSGLLALRLCVDREAGGAPWLADRASPGRGLSAHWWVTSVGAAARPRNSELLSTRSRYDAAAFGRIWGCGATTGGGYGVEPAISRWYSDGSVGW